MKNALALSLFTLTFGLQALAENPQPWKSMVGKYSISETCKIDRADGYNKVQISLSKNGQELELKTYKGSNANTVDIPVADFQRKADGTDGDVFFSVLEATETSFVSSRHFVRKGSTSWPDLEMIDGYALSLENGVLNYKESHQSTFTKSGPVVTTCEMTRLGDSQDVDSKPIKKIKDKDLAKLAAAAHTADTSGMDLDQANFQIASFKVSTTNLNHDQLVEVLNLQVPFENVEITTQAVTTETPSELAEKSLQTAFENASDLQKPEYQSLWALKSAVIELLSLKKANLKVIYIEWSESDSDGEGLLIMDQSTGESFYFGSGYFS